MYVCKRRKINTEEYISIQEIWGTPSTTKPSKNKNEDIEYNQTSNKRKKESPRPSKGSPSLGTPCTQIGEKITNLRTLENHIYEAPEYNKNLEYIENWEEKIKEYRNSVVIDEEKRQKRISEKKKKEESWELYRICKKYLEDNSRDWEKMKEKRKAEKEKQIRLEKAGILKRKEKMKQLERNVMEGLNKIPTEEKNRISLML